MATRRAKVKVGLAVAGLLAGVALVRGLRRGGPAMAYRPLGAVKRVAAGLFVVDGLLHGMVPVRMTVVRLPDGSVLLHSPVSYSAELRRAVEEIGPIEHLVAPSLAHWVFMKAWQDAVPEARTYAAPGLRARGQVRRSGLRLDEDLGDAAPAAWGDAIEQVVVPGRFGYREVAMLHRPSETALMVDLVQNFEPEKLPAVLRPVAWALGNTTRLSRAPAHLRAVVAGAPGAAEAARRIVAWSPRRVMVTHGRPIEAAAAARLRRSLAWLTG